MASQNRDEIYTLILDVFKDMKNDFSHRFDRIDSQLEKFITKDDCKRNRENCPSIYSQQQSRVTLQIWVQRTAAIGGISVILAALAKLLYELIGLIQK